MCIMVWSSDVCSSDLFFARRDTNIFCVSFARCTTILRLHTAAALMSRDVQRAVGLNAALMADQAWLLFGVEAAMSGVIAMVVAVRGNRIAGSSGLRKAACVSSSGSSGVVVGHASPSWLGAVLELGSGHIGRAAGG